MTAFVTWILPIQRADGTVDQVPTVAHGTAIFVFDAGDIPLGLPVTPGAPPFLRVYDKDDNPIDVLLGPAVIGPELVDAPATPLSPNQAVNPGPQKSLAATLKLQFYGHKIVAPALAASTAACIAPTIVRGTKAHVIAQPVKSISAALSPVSFAPTSGALAPAVSGSSSAAILPRGIAHGAIAKSPATQASTSSALAHALAHAGKLTPGIQKALATVLGARLIFAQAAAPAVQVSTAAALAPVGRIMGTTHKLPTVPAATAAALAPASVAYGGPPTFPQVTAASSSALEPKLVGAGARTPGVAAATSAPLAITKSMGTRTSSPALFTSSAQVLAPTIVRTKNVTPAVLSSSATAPAIASVTDRRAAAAQASSSATLAPTFLRAARTCAPAIASSPADVLEPEVTSPHRYLKPDVQICAAETLQPERTFATLTLSPATVASSAVARGGTPVEDLVPPDVVLEADVVTYIDFTEEHDVMQQCQQSQAGIVFDIPMRTSSGTPLDLTGATQVKVWLRPPTGAAKQRDAEVLGEPTKGVVRYTTGPADLHEHGVWGVQVSVQLANGLPSWSAIVLLRVNANIGPYGPQSTGPQATSVAGALEPGIVFS